MKHSELQIDWWQLNREEKANDCSTSAQKVRRKQKKKENSQEQNIFAHKEG